MFYRFTRLRIRIPHGLALASAILLGVTSWFGASGQGTTLTELADSTSAKAYVDSSEQGFTVTGGKAPPARASKISLLIFGRR